MLNKAKLAMAALLATTTVPAQAEEVRKVSNPPQEQPVTIEDIVGKVGAAHNCISENTVSKFCATFTKTEYCLAYMKVELQSGEMTDFAKAADCLAAFEHDLLNP